MLAEVTVLLTELFEVFKLLSLATLVVLIVVGLSIVSLGLLSSALLGRPRFFPEAEFVEKHLNT